MAIKKSDDNTQHLIYTGQENMSHVPLLLLNPEEQEMKIQNLAGITAKRGREDWESQKLADLLRVSCAMGLETRGCSYAGPKSGEDHRANVFWYLNNPLAYILASQYTMEDNKNNIGFFANWTQEADKDAKGNDQHYTFGFFYQGEKPEPMQIIEALKKVSSGELSIQQWNEFKEGHPIPEQVESFFSRGIDMLVDTITKLRLTDSEQAEKITRAIATNKHITPEIREKFLNTKVKNKIETTAEGSACANILECLQPLTKKIAKDVNHYDIEFRGEPQNNKIIVGECGIIQGVKGSKIPFEGFSTGIASNPESFIHNAETAVIKYFDLTYPKFNKNADK